MGVDIRSRTTGDEMFCKQVTEQESVRLLPGSHYGKGGQGYVRINLATQRLRLCQAGQRIVNFVNSLT